MYNLHLKILTPAFWLHFWELLTENALNAVLRVAVLVLLYVILQRTLGRIMNGLLARLLTHESRGGMSEERMGRLQTLQGLARSILSYVLFFVFGVLLMEAVGFDILPLITTASVLGVAIALGSQKLFKDVISGFFLIVDNIYIVGDTVTIAGITGTVQDIGMRVTRVRDAGGRLHQFANGDIGTVTNLSRYPVEDFIEINVAVDADLKRVTEVLNAAGQKFFDREDNRLKAPPVVQGVSALAVAAMTVRVSLVAAPNDLTAQQMLLRSVLREALLAAGIALA